MQCQSVTPRLTKFGTGDDNMPRNQRNEIPLTLQSFQGRRAFPWALQLILLRPHKGPMCHGRHQLHFWAWQHTSWYKLWFVCCCCCCCCLTFSVESRDLLCLGCEWKGVYVKGGWGSVPTETAQRIILMFHRCRSQDSKKGLYPCLPAEAVYDMRWTYRSEISVDVLQLRITASPPSNWNWGSFRASEFFFLYQNRL